MSGPAPLPMPADFVEVSMRQSVQTMVKTYGKSRYTIDRWVSELPKALRVQRVKAMRKKQNEAGAASFSGAQKLFYELGDEKTLRQRAKRSNDMLVEAHRAFSAKTGWPVREYAA